MVLTTSSIVSESQVTKLPGEVRSLLECLFLLGFGAGRVWGGRWASGWVLGVTSGVRISEVRVALSYTKLLRHLYGGGRRCKGNKTQQKSHLVIPSRKSHSTKKTKKLPYIPSRWNCLCSCRGTWTVWRRRVPRLEAAARACFDAAAGGWGQGGAAGFHQGKLCSLRSGIMLRQGGKRK